MANNFSSLIGTNFFDKIFKDSLRNYYVYGFKSFSNTNKSNKTEYAHQKRIVGILKDEWKYKVSHKDVHYISYDKSWQTNNPLNKLYAFHLSKNFKFYFPTLLELSSYTQYNNVYPKTILNSKDKEGDLLTNKKGQFITDNWSLDQLIEFARNSDVQKKIRSATNLEEMCLLVNDYPFSKHTFGNHKIALSQLGIIHQATNAEFKQLLNDLQNDLVIDPNMKMPDKDLWVLSDTIECLYQVLDHNNNNIKDLNEMIQFFSQYEILGSIGTRLLNRIHTKANDVIHYKNNYIMETLYDYNLISLLVAIENHDYCYIKYTHGTSNNVSEHFVYPLEIRISVKNGRQHLIYYDMIRNMVSSLRIDFMDKIELYDANYPIKINETIKDKTNEYTFTQIPDIPNDILDYIWGVDTGLLVLDSNNKNDYKKMLTTVTIYCENDDFMDQIRKERRHGQMNYYNNTMSIDVLSVNEMIPWIRSLYPHIKDYQQTTHNFIYKDTNEMDYAYNKQAPLELLVSNNSITITKGTKISSFLHNGALFNELFSYKNMIIADSYLEYASQDDYSEDTLNKIIYHNIKKYQDYIALEYFEFDYSMNNIAKDIHDILKNQIKLIDKHKPLYISEKQNYLDILPLTTLELRWLKTMINEPAAKLFINVDTITKLNQYLDDHQIKAFDIKNIIKYYDCENYNRLKSENYPSQNYINQFQKLYMIIDNKDIQKVRITLSSGDILEGYPGWLEFSKLKDTFYLVTYDDINNLRLFIEISRIQHIEELSLTKTKKEVQEILEKNYQCQVSLSFDDVRNVPDRILNEFAPWQKECVYHEEKHPTYTMTLYYDKSDEEDIIRRILSYGPYLKINDENNPICQSIKKIIHQQKENFIIQTKTI
ncbi:MAG: WYL domain-containing protein [Erysipelotrichaceae bacterium]|nr:WYL domain-containing protein [Erysipelotrichaceae bacterium]